MKACIEDKARRRRQWAWFIGLILAGMAVTAAAILLIRWCMPGR